MGQLLCFYVEFKEGLRHFGPVTSPHAGHTSKKAAPELETAFAEEINMF